MFKTMTVSGRRKAGWTRFISYKAKTSVGSQVSSIKFALPQNFSEQRAVKLCERVWRGQDVL
jgi:hypothetical protein